MRFSLLYSPPFPIVEYPELHTFLLPSKSRKTFMISIPGLEELGKEDTGGRRQSSMNVVLELGAGKSHLEDVWSTQTKKPCWKISYKELRVVVVVI